MPVTFDATSLRSAVPWGFHMQVPFKACLDARHVHQILTQIFEQARRNALHDKRLGVGDGSLTLSRLLAAYDTALRAHNLVPEEDTQLYRALMKATLCGMPNASSLQQDAHARPNTAAGCERVRGRPEREVLLLTSDKPNCRKLTDIELEQCALQSGAACSLREAPPSVALFSTALMQCVYEAPMQVDGLAPEACSLLLQQVCAWNAAASHAELRAARRAFERWRRAAADFHAAVAAHSNVSLQRRTLQAWLHALHLTKHLLRHADDIHRLRLVAQSFHIWRHAADVAAVRRAAHKAQLAYFSAWKATAAQRKASATTTRVAYANCLHRAWRGWCQAVAGEARVQAHVLELQQIQPAHHAAAGVALWNSRWQCVRRQQALHERAELFASLRAKAACINAGAIATRTLQTRSKSRVSRLRCLQMLRSAFSTWGVCTRAINSAREAAMRHGHQRRQRVLRDVFRCWCALFRMGVFGFFVIMTTLIDIKRLSGLELVLKAAGLLRYMRLARSALCRWRHAAEQSAWRCAAKTMSERHALQRTLSQRQALQRTLLAWRQPPASCTGSFASDNRAGAATATPAPSTRQGVNDVAVTEFVHREQEHGSVPVRCEAPCPTHEGHAPACAHAVTMQHHADRDEWAPLLSARCAAAAAPPDEARAMLRAWASLARNRSVTVSAMLQALHQRRASQSASRAFALWLRATATRREHTLALHVCARFAATTLLRRAVAGWRMRGLRSALRHQPMAAQHIVSSNSDLRRSVSGARLSAARVGGEASGCIALSKPSLVAGLQQAAAQRPCMAPRAMLLGTGHPLSVTLDRLLRSLCEQVDHSAAVAVPCALFAPWQIHLLLPQHRVLLATLGPGTWSARFCASQGLLSSRPQCGGSDRALLRDPPARGAHRDFGSTAVRPRSCSTQRQLSVHCVDEAPVPDTSGGACSAAQTREQQQRTALAAWRTAAAIRQGWRTVLRQSRAQGERCTLRHSLRCWHAAHVQARGAAQHARRLAVASQGNDSTTRLCSPVRGRSASRARRRSCSAMYHVRWRSRASSMHDSLSCASILDRATLLLQRVLSRQQWAAFRAWREVTTATAQASHRNLP